VFSGLKFEEQKELRAFDPIASLVPGGSTDEKIHVNFNGRADPIKLTVTFVPLAAGNPTAQPAPQKITVKLTPPIGELLKPELVSNAEFEARQSTPVLPLFFSSRPPLISFGCCQQRNCRVCRRTQSLCAATTVCSLRSKLSTL
jgi:hypothetical protein